LGFGGAGVDLVAYCGVGGAGFVFLCVFWVFRRGWGLFEGFVYVFEELVVGFRRLQGRQAPVLWGDRAVWDGGYGDFSQVVFCVWSESMKDFAPKVWVVGLCPDFLHGVVDFHAFRHLGKPAHFVVVFVYGEPEIHAA